MSSVKVKFKKPAFVPDGCYNVVVKYVKLKQSKSSSNEYLCWFLEIVDGDYKGNTLFLSTSLSINATWRLRKLLYALDFPCDDESIELQLHKFAGKMFRVQVVKDIYNARIINEIVDFGSLNDPYQDNLPDFPVEQFNVK